MHKVTAIRHVEDCFDGDFIKEFELDAPLDTAIMNRLAEKARLQYHPEFPRPYFSDRQTREVHDSRRHWKEDVPRDVFQIDVARNRNGPKVSYSERRERWVRN